MTKIVRGTGPEPDVFIWGGPLEGPVLQQGELSMVCVGLQCIFLQNAFGSPAYVNQTILKLRKNWGGQRGAKQKSGRAMAHPGPPLESPLGTRATLGTPSNF